MKKGLSLSGGSTKIAGLAGAAVTICKDFGYKPDLITGISAGSIIALPLALGMYDKVSELTTSAKTLNGIFNIRPVNKNNKPTARGILRAANGEESFGEQKNLTTTLKKVISEDDFRRYQAGNFADIYLGAVEYRTGARQYFDIKRGTYEAYFQAVQASSSIPVFVESVKINDVTTYSGKKIDKGFWYDGGIRDHIGSHWMMENFTGVKEHISVYSRPKNYDITDLTWCPNNIIDVLQRTMDIMNVEKSKNDEYQEQNLAKELKIRNNMIFLNMPTELGYRIDEKLLKEWYGIGKKAVQDAM